MAKNTLVISVELRETRVALIEDGIIAELHIERKGQTNSGTVGNVVLGKVTRVLPGLQAAFIDVGQERAAFLHVEDLIRPDDFEAYLYGAKTSKSEDKGAVALVGEVETEESDSARDGAKTIGDAAVGGITSATIAELERPSVPFLVDRPSQPELPSDFDSGPVLPLAGAPLLIRAEEREEISFSEEIVAITERSSQLLLTAVDEDGVPESGEGPSASAHGSQESNLGGASLDESDDDEGDEPEALDAGGDDADDEDDEDDQEDDDDDAADSEGASTSSDDRDDDGALAAAPEGATTGVHKTSAAASPLLAPALDDDFGDLPGFTISDPNEPTPKAVPRDARRRGRSRNRGGGNDRGGNDRGGSGRGGNSSSSKDRNSDRRGPNPLHQNRISKTTPIQEVVKEGQEIIVQISKDPISTKGARCTSHVSLAGRYVVYLPTVDHIGLSKRIGNDRERSRLRQVIESIKPAKGGIIVRTVAEGLTKKQLKQDIGYLVRLWEDIAARREGARAPIVLNSELDLVLKTARDLFTDEVDRIIIDDKQQYERLCRFVEMFAPDRLKDITLYAGEDPIFDAHGIEDEIARALSRKVPLPSGGYLIIDQAEALTAIDVNTGRFVGKGSKDLEETILKTNMEAVQEIAYQLRFRNIGGLIILDLIDMEKSSSREKVRRALEEILKKDKAKTSLNRISDLGLIEMTRKRTRESLGRLLHEPCFYCDGTGQLQSKETIAYEILREIRRRRNDLPGYSIVINAHPAITDVLLGPERAALQDAENRFMRKIIVTPHREYHYEQFDVQGK